MLIERSVVKLLSEDSRSRCAVDKLDSALSSTSTSRPKIRRLCGNHKAVAAVAVRCVAARDAEEMATHAAPAAARARFRQPRSAAMKRRSGKPVFSSLKRERSAPFNECHQLHDPAEHGVAEVTGDEESTNQTVLRLCLRDLRVQHLLNTSTRIGNPCRITVILTCLFHFGRIGSLPPKLSPFPRNRILQ